MKKDKFQPIVMPCTKEQYEALLPVLREYRFKQNFITSVYDTPKIRYDLKSITNNHNGVNGNVSINTKSIDNSIHEHFYDRKIYKRFNRKIFLKSLGIIEEPEFVLPLYWFIKVTNENIEFLTKQYKFCPAIGGVIGHSKSAPSINHIGYDHKEHSTNKRWVNEITFEQFQKYVIKQESNLGLFEPSRLDINNVQSYDILESQLVTNKQTNTMVKTVN